VSVPFSFFQLFCKAVRTQGVGAWVDIHKIDGRAAIECAVGASRPQVPCG
jgi:hypothetical protein